MGGVATTEVVSHPAGGERLKVNDGVQGAAPSYANTLLFHKELGFTHRRVRMTASFNTGSQRWSNIDPEPAPILKRLKREIARFGATLRFVNAFRAVFVGMSIRRLLQILGYAKEFGARVVFPITVLFFGTGNRTGDTSCVLSDELAAWWAAEAKGLPAWSSLAADVFLIVPSSCAVERVFSVLRDTFDKQQKNAGEDYLETSVMLQFNSRPGSGR